MSVLMRGVDMPKNCEECNFKGECRQYWEKIREVYTRPSWCPLVEVSDSEIPNNCEVKNYCDDCLYTDTCDSKEFFYACTSKATISKMEQVDKDINVRSKDEPQPCEWCKFYDGENCFSQEPCKVMLYFKTEPQTERNE